MIKIISFWTICVGCFTLIAYLINPLIATPVLTPEEQKFQSLLEHRYKKKFPESAMLAHAFVTAANHEGIDVMYLLAVCEVESSTLDPQAKSHDGSYGICGVQPKIWNKKPYNVYDKYENIFQAAYILAEYNKRRDELSEEAIKTYNVGPTGLKTMPAAAERYITKVNKVHADLSLYSAAQVDTL